MRDWKREEWEVAVLEAAHKYATWADAARTLRAQYKERFKKAHPLGVGAVVDTDDGGNDVRGYETLCVKRDSPGDGPPPDRESWCQGCVAASSLRDQYQHAVRKRAAAAWRLERLHHGQVAQ